MSRRDRRTHLGYVTFFFLFCAAFAAGYGITALLYRFTGRPPEILRHMFSGLTAMLVVFLLGQGVLRFRGRHQEDFLGIRDQLTGALAQIAQGQFDVLLDPDKTGFYHEFVDAINDMAKNLGTIETMRQDFISNVSHEIQSPLTSIGGFAALLQKDGLPDEERRRYAAVIETESKRLSSLSDNLLKLSSLDNNKAPLARKEFRLDKQLERIALTLEPQWSAKNLTLEADLQKLTVFGDEDLLSQAWVNLLHNAIKFTPGGGRIDISLSMDDDSAVVKISDTGDGIAQEDQVHIFERFYKVDKARDRSLGGNGLGLSLVKKIIELHGGSVTVESEAGRGSAFEIRLGQGDI